MEGDKSFGRRKEVRVILPFGPFEWRLLGEARLREREREIQEAMRAERRLMKTRGLRPRRLRRGALVPRPV